MSLNASTASLRVLLLPQRVVTTRVAFYLVYVGVKLGLASLQNDTSCCGNVIALKVWQTLIATRNSSHFIQSNWCKQTQCSGRQTIKFIPRRNQPSPLRLAPSHPFYCISLMNNQVPFHNGMSWFLWNISTTNPSQCLKAISSHELRESLRQFIGETFVYFPLDFFFSFQFLIQIQIVPPFLPTRFCTACS